MRNLLVAFLILFPSIIFVIEKESVVIPLSKKVDLVITEGKLEIRDKLFDYLTLIGSFEPIAMIRIID